jgi:hypothetical protein
LGEGDLEVVTGDRFVEGEGHHFPFEAHVRGVEIDLKRKWLRANLPPSMCPQGFPLLGWHHLIDATFANREALRNQAQRHLHPFPFPFLGLTVKAPGRLPSGAGRR